MEEKHKRLAKLIHLSQEEVYYLKIEAERQRTTIKGLIENLVAQYIKEVAAKEQASALPLDRIVNLSLEKIEAKLKEASEDMEKPRKLDLKPQSVHEETVNMWRDYDRERLGTYVEELERLKRELAEQKAAEPQPEPQPKTEEDPAVKKVYRGRVKHRTDWDLSPTVCVAGRMYTRKTVPVYEGVKQLQAYVRDSAVNRILGMNGSWYAGKCNRRGGYASGFYPEDVDSVNGAIHALGQVVLQYRIEPEDARAVITEKMRALGRIFPAPELYAVRFGKDQTWWYNKLGTYGNGFSLEERAYINATIEEAAYALCVTQLVL
jgi:ribosomal protein L13E